MNSVQSKLENNVDELYRKNEVKSIGFLVLLGVCLLLTILLSLRAGSYETPIKELVKGIFGMSADRKIICHTKKGVSVTISVLLIIFLRLRILRSDPLFQQVKNIFLQMEKHRFPQIGRSDFSL